MVDPPETVLIADPAWWPSPCRTGQIKRCLGRPEIDKRDDRSGFRAGRSAERRQA